jgi:hypothetical protein
VLFNKLLNADKFFKGNAMLGDEELLVDGEVLFWLEFFGEC